MMAYCLHVRGNTVQDYVALRYLSDFQLNSDLSTDPRHINLSAYRCFLCLGIANLRRQDVPIKEYYIYFEP